MSDKPRWISSKHKWLWVVLTRFAPDDIRGVAFERKHKAFVYMKNDPDNRILLHKMMESEFSLYRHCGWDRYTWSCYKDNRLIYQKPFDYIRDLTDEKRKNLEKVGVYYFDLYLE